MNFNHSRATSHAIRPMMDTARKIPTPRWPIEGLGCLVWSTVRSTGICTESFFAARFFAARLLANRFIATRFFADRFFADRFLATRFLAAL
jgi:hypothetical protein